jgi:hypothetical protein
VLLGKVKNSGAAAPRRLNEFTLHLLGIGSTGCGKTNWLLWLIWQIHQVGGVGTWIIDRKLDYRGLLRYDPNILVFDLARNFRLNPLQPPRLVDARKWANVFVDLFCHENNLLDGSRGMLVTTLTQLFEDYGVYEGSRDYPSFFELLGALKNLKLGGHARPMGFRDSLVGRLESYVMTNGQLYDCSIGFDLESLISKTVVFEVTGLLDVQCDYLVNHLLHWLFCFRLLGERKRGDKLLTLAVFDEANKVFSPYRNSALGERPITSMVSQLREFGVGLACTAQTSRLDRSIFANSAVKALFSSGGEDLTDAVRAMGLTPEQAAYSRNLGVGEAIVHHQRIGKTFVLEIPKFGE